MQHRRIRHAVLRGQRVDPAKLDAAKRMRCEPTQGEGLAWEILRGRRLDGLKFRRQQVISGFIADFYCAEHRIVLEIDGDVHDREGAAEADAQRSVVFARLDIAVARIKTNEVSAETIREVLVPLLKRSSPPLP
jgi:very-short-patch-repair endonuclease